MGENLKFGDKKIEAFVYLSSPFSDYERLYSPGLKAFFSTLSPSINKVITFLDHYVTREELGIGTPSYFIKSFRNGNLNYIAIGQRSFEVNKSRGQVAPYIYMFILKVSDYLKYSIDLEKLLRKVRSYEELYRELERGVSPAIESVPLDEVALTGCKEDWRIPVIDSWQEGYIIYVDSLEEALRRLRELYRNIWLRILFDFMVIRGYRRSPPPGTIVISYGANLEKSLKLREDISLDVIDACKGLAKQFSYHDTEVESNPCIVLDYVEDYKERVKRFIDTYVIRFQLLQTVGNIINSIESTPFTKENLTIHGKLLEDLSKYREQLLILGWEEYYSKALDKLKERMQKDLDLYKCIDLINYVKLGRMQPAGGLKDLLNLAQKVCESFDKELPEKLSNILHGVLVEHRPLSDEDITIIKYASEKITSLFSTDSLRSSSVYKLVMEREADLSAAAKNFIEESKKLIERFREKYKSFDTLCNELKSGLEKLEKLLSREGLKNWTKDIEGVLSEKCSTLGKIKDSVKRSLKEMEDVLKNLT